MRRSWKSDREHCMTMTKVTLILSKISRLCQSKLFTVRVSWIFLFMVVMIFYNKKDNINEYVTDMVDRVKVEENVSVVIRMSSTPSTLTKSKTTIKEVEDSGDGVDDNCQGFNNDPLHPSITKFFKKTKSITCKRGYPNLVYADKKKNRLVIDQKKAKRLKNHVDYCQYVSLMRQKGTDFKVVTSKWSNRFNVSIKIPGKVDHFLCKCFDGKKMVGYGYISIIRVKADKEKIYQKRLRNHVAKKKPKETLSIMLIGIDGTSKHNFERQMPKTREYLKNKVGAIEMFKLNKVGLNTFPNVVPLLSGYSSREVRKTWNDTTFFDKIDNLFLWSDAQKIGYRTSVILDQKSVTSFHFQKKGWNKPIFDYYYRPVVLKATYDKSAHKMSGHCVGDRPEISVFYDYWLDMATTFNNSRTQPYFAYSFFAHLTHHKVNTASAADDIYLELFKTFMKKKLLNNTLVVFFSDHGTRFGEFRSTFRGMLEDSNPFMFFIFPPWFKEKYPKIMTNFRNNQHRMMTNYDVHATLKDILNFHGDEMIRTENKNTRGISLFQELPQSRTCKEAGIPLQYCNCQPKNKMHVSFGISEPLSKSFLKHVISQTEKYREKCVVLSMNATITVMTMSLHSSTKLYQATIKTMPGGAIYEASLRKKKGNPDFTVIGDVARLNMYRGQAECINDARLMPFCYCRILPNRGLHSDSGDTDSGENSSL